MANKNILPHKGDKKQIIERIIKINKSMPTPIKIEQGFVDKIYNQFKAILSSSNSTVL